MPWRSPSGRRDDVGARIDVPPRAAFGNRLVAIVLATATFASTAAAETLTLHRMLSIDGQWRGRVCGDAAHRPALAADATGAVALRLGDIVWLRVGPDGTIERPRADSARPAGRIVREADGRYAARVDVDDADCAMSASLVFDSDGAESVESQDVERGIDASSAVARALAQRRAGDQVGARDALVVAGAGAAPEATRRWAGLHLARVQLELGDTIGASRTLDEAGTLAARMAGLDAFAELVGARVRAGRGEFFASIAAREALASDLATRDPDGEDRVANDVYLAGIENYVGRTDVAYARLRGIASRLGAFAPADPLRVDAAIVESQILAARNDSDGAARVLREALAALPASSAFTYARAQLVRELAAHRIGDRPLEHLAPMRRAVSWYAANIGEDNPLTIIAEAMLAALQAHAGRVDEAIATQRRVVAYYARGAPSDLTALIAQHALANYLLKARRWREGVDALVPAISRADDIGDALAAQRAHMRIDLASAQWELEGESAACATVAQARMLASRSELGEQQELDLRTLEAACLAHRDRRAGIAALVALRELRISRYGDTSRAAIFGHAALARQLIAAGATGAAIAELERMSAALEALRPDELPEAGGGRAMFSDWMPSDAVYAGLRDLAGLYFGERRFADAIRAAEAMRARTIDDALGARDRVDALADTERVRAASIAARIREVEADTSLLPRGSIDRARLDDERARLAAELDVLTSRARPRRPASTDDLRRRLPPRTAYVGVQIANDQAWAYVLRRDRTPAAVALPRLPKLARVVAPLVESIAQADALPVRLWRLPDGDFVRALAAPSASATSMTIDEALRALFAAVVEPIAGELRGIRRVAVALDAPLSALPFDLVARDRRLSIDVAPSLASWVALHERAAPAYDVDIAALSPPDYAALSDPARVRPEHAPARWPALPAARDEIRHVVALFRRSQVLEADRALLAEAQARATLAGARFVHVAAHAYLSPAEPSWSSLVVADGDHRLGYLTAAEISTFSLPSELVVLSACETGRGREMPGEGLFGLPYAIIVAGARAAVLTLWPVADDSAAEFMKRFYAKLARGMGPSDALAATKREFRRDRRWSAPLHWAPFVLYGAG